MEKLKFYDLKSRKPFTTDEYEIRIRNNRRFAVAIAPSGIESWRILGMVK